MFEVDPKRARQGFEVKGAEQGIRNPERQHGGNGAARVFEYPAAVDHAVAFRFSSWQMDDVARSVHLPLNIAFAEVPHLPVQEDRVILGQRIPARVSLVADRGAEEDHVLPERGVQDGERSHGAVGVGEEPLELGLDKAGIAFGEVLRDVGEHLLQRLVEVGEGDLPEYIGFKNVLLSVFRGSGFSGQEEIHRGENAGLTAFDQSVRRRVQQRADRSSALRNDPQLLPDP